MMATNTAASAGDMLIGDAAAGGQSFWLSPALIGLSAPIVLGMVLAPHLLQGAASIIGLLLAFMLVLAIGAYILSILTPGDAKGIAVRGDAREVAIVRSGLISRSEVSIPFADIARVVQSKRYDHDGYELMAIEVQTRSGDSWVVPAEISDAELVQMRRMIGITAKSR